MLFGDRKTTLEHPSHVPNPSFCTISTWVVSIEVISCGGITAAGQRVENFTSIYIFHFLFDVAITNSYILQKSFCPNSTIKNIKDFRLKLAMQLIGEYCSRQRAGRRPVAIRPLPLRHFPVRITSDSEAVKHKRGRCVYCKETSHTRKDSYWFCRECEVWLCHSGYSDDCFLLWHTRRLSADEF